jgi:glycosyltransferase involved in cell wall biosynthesis
MWFAERGDHVTLLVPRTSANASVLDRVPEALHPVLVPLRPPRTRSGAFVDRLRYTGLGSVPPPRESRGLLAADGLLRHAHAAHLIELHWGEYSYFGPVLKQAGVNAPVVVFSHDVLLEAERRRLVLERPLVSLLRRYALIHVHRRMEARQLSVAELVAVFKSGDKALLRRMGVEAPVTVTDPYIDVPSSLAKGGDGSSVLFTGALWRHENEHGLRWFLAEVWPLVLRDVPAARLTLAGAGATPALRDAAARAEQVKVTDYVPDLDPYYRRSSVFVAPLLVGAGLKFKVVQAMHYALPVVATTVAAEGIVERAPAAALAAVTDNPQEFAAGVVRVLREREWAALVGKTAATWAASTYSFERASRHLAKLYRDLVVPRDPGCASR